MQTSDVMPLFPSKSICSKSGQLYMNGYKSLSFIPRRVPIKSFRSRGHPMASDRKQSPGILTPKLRNRSLKSNYSMYTKALKYQVKKYIKI